MTAMTAPQEMLHRIRTARAQERREVKPGEVEETLAIASSALAVIALVCAWMLLQMLVLGGVAEQRSQHMLYAQFRNELAQEIAPLGELDYNGNPVVLGSPVAIISIPKLGLEQVVVDGTASGDLLNGPGHLRDTPLPGMTGTSVVMGRASTYGAPFKHIDELAPGDEIITQTQAGRAIYSVTDVRRAGDPLPAGPTGTQGELTLVTGQGTGFLSSLRPRDAIYVDATTDKATPPGAVAGAVPSSELAMARDTGALPTLALFLAVLVAIVLAVSVARRHFRTALVWVFAAPLVITLAWATTDQVMRLLPNLM